MRVLIACEYSGTVRDAFRKRGHDAWSCDILPTEQDGPHYQCDALEALKLQKWDLLIAHPPCTYLANSGVQHLHTDPSRWAKLHDGRELFMALLRADVPRTCVENPIPHKYAALPKYTQIVHPWQHGHEVMKATCLWLRGLPPLEPTNVVGKGEKHIGKNGKSNGSAWYQIGPKKNRGHLRSKTFQGIADAMAAQWG